ncbi:MAG: response regulator [Acidobacteria bacterium]|nr:response regulator [Acidobacteriota bacterium]
MPPTRVLVADDSRIFRLLVSEVLRDRGIAVVEATNGREALDRTLSERPELLILDALMPLLSGFDVLAKLREKAPEYEPIVFIVTAVYKSRRWESEARQTYRVHEYLEKPIEPEDLLKAIARYFPDVHA